MGLPILQSQMYKNSLKEIDSFNSKTSMNMENKRCILDGVLLSTIQWNWKDVQNGEKGKKKTLNSPLSSL